MPKGKSQDRLREKKKNHIFNIIINNRDLSKFDIKKESGYSMTSVINIINELSEAGLVTVNESGMSGGGRPPQMVNAAPSGGYIIGIDFSRESINCAVFNLKREITDSIIEKTQDIVTSEDFISRLIDVTEKVLKPYKDKNILGIGIGVPGYIDEKKGTVSRYRYITGYKDVPVRDILREHFKVPVFLENNVNAMALGFKWLHRKGKVKSLMIIAVRRGIKAAFIINNSLIKGADGLAGEIGSLKYDGETYEEILSDYSITRDLKLNKAGDIIDLAEGGDEKATAYLKMLSDRMSELINIGKAIINPEEIMIIGEYAGSGYFINLLKEKTDLLISGGNAAELGPVGAAGLVIEKLFNF